MHYATCFGFEVVRISEMFKPNPLIYFDMA